MLIANYVYNNTYVNTFKLMKNTTVLSKVVNVNVTLTKNFGNADGFWRKRSAFLCALFFLEKGSAICIWFRDINELVWLDRHLENKRPI